MSFDLAVWDCNGLVTNQDVKVKYESFCERLLEAKNGPPTLKIKAFVQELEDRFPANNPYVEEDLEDCPWNSAFDTSGDFTLLTISWARVAEVAPFVTMLARKHGMICYNPQDESIAWPEMRSAR